MSGLPRQPMPCLPKQKSYSLPMSRAANGVRTLDKTSRHAHPAAGADVRYDALARAPMARPSHRSQPEAKTIIGKAGGLLAEPRSSTAPQAAHDRMP